MPEEKQSTRVTGRSRFMLITKKVQYKKIYPAFSLGKKRIIISTLLDTVGCIDDIRLEGKHLPLPTALNGTQWGQATNYRNLSPNCPSNKPCANVICPPPFECVDRWNDYDCE
jgi:hypothetical protein